MFAAPGLILLVLTDYFKPQEYLPFLAGWPLLYVFTGLTLAGFVLDLRLGLSRLRAAPQLWLALAFVAWCAFTNLQNGFGEVLRNTFALLVPFSLFLLIAHCVQTFRALRWMMVVVLVSGVAVALVGVEQGFAPWGCHKATYVAGKARLVFDGRSCTPEEAGVCERAGEPGFDYRCERVGLFGTQTIRGRVRFRGTMEDPNELALAVAAVLPFGFALLYRRRSASGGALLVATVALAGTCAVLTHSRTGQVVFVVALAFYIVKRFGFRALAVLGVAALPVLLLGGRSDAEAASSTLERIECWGAGLAMTRRSPLFGVGLGQFLEHHYLTAHNSYILTAAELGLPGMILWLSIVYLSVKICIRLVRAAPHPAGGAAADVAPSYALALLAAMAAFVAGMMFLSYAYKELLWIYLGLSGALYQAVKRHDETFTVRFRFADLAVVIAAAAACMITLQIYTRFVLGY